MNKKALIVVDVQNDFCPGGSLAVKDGDQVVDPLNRLTGATRGRSGWMRIASRDWHPGKTSHFDKWPAHCVRHTKGAEFCPGLDISGTNVFLKGTKAGEDAYSAFDGIGGFGHTLGQFLTINRVVELYVGGLATDYCVKATVLDALKKGFKVTLLTDACRAVDVKPGDGLRAITEMINAGVYVSTTEEVINELDN
ncbi:MAG: isochorismatase family protein [bacterium]|nr:isochorismatase family protein [bacterium]